MSQLTIFHSCRDVSYTEPVNSFSQVHKVVLPIVSNQYLMVRGITAYIIIFMLSSTAGRPEWLPV